MLRQSILLGLVLLLISSNTNLHGQNAKLQDEFVKAFEKHYSVQKRMKAPFTKNFSNDGLKEASVIFFASKDTIKKNTRLRFNITVYSYNSNITAAQNLTALKSNKLSQNDMILGKNYDLVILHKNFLARLDAGCLYSEKAWEELKQLFLKQLAEEATNANSIECFCGGNCR